MQWPFALHHGDDATTISSIRRGSLNHFRCRRLQLPRTRRRLFHELSGRQQEGGTAAALRLLYGRGTAPRRTGDRLAHPRCAKRSLVRLDTRLRCVRLRPAYSELDRIAVHVLCGAPVHRFQHARRRSPACRIEDPGSRLVAELDRRSRDLVSVRDIPQRGHACGKSGNNPTFGPDSWGATAAAGPEDRYHAYGSLPSGSQPESDGTIAPYGAGLAVLSAPARAIAALRQYAATPLWTPRFGLMDAYNLEPSCGERPWYSHDLVGIDEGPMLIAIDDLRTGYVQRLMTIIRGSRPSCARFILPAPSRQSPARLAWLGRRPALPCPPGFRRHPVLRRRPREALHGVGDGTRPQRFPRHPWRRRANPARR